MAFKRYFHNSSTDASMAAGWASALEDALAYAGFDDLTVTETSGTIKVFQGETATDDNTFINFYVSGDSNLTVYMDSTRYISKTFGLYVSVIATKKAVALCGCLTDGTSNGGVIIAKDTAGTYVLITNPAATIAAQTLNNPAVMPRGLGLTSIPTLSVSTSYAFGCTSLCNFPSVAAGDGAAYIADVFMATAGQYTSDGSVTMNNISYYSIGGGWYLRDVSA